jgi:hypothetical protein
MAYGTCGFGSEPLRQRSRASHQRISAERQHPGRRPGVHGNGQDDQAAHPAPQDEDDVTPTSKSSTPRPPGSEPGGLSRFSASDTPTTSNNNDTSNNDKGTDR